MLKFTMGKVKESRGLVTKFKKRWKKCTKCGRNWPITAEYFHRCKRNKDGYDNQCKFCRNRIRRENQTEESKFTSYEYEAKQRNLEFEISYNEFVKLISLPCRYCGAKPDPYNGIDRIDNSKGYIKGNCVSCCICCNRMKLAMTLKEFAEQIVEMYDWAVGYLKWN